MRVGACTDTGTVRQINEDCYYIPQDINRDIPLFIVADGMGGHRAGEVASKDAVDSVVKHITDNFENYVNENVNLLKLLKESILRANHIIYEKSLTDVSLDGMGTTLAAVLIHNNKLYIGHVGDSRVYVVRRNNIYQLTRDHSYVEHLVENGTITRDQAASHPQRNIITRALGCEEIVEIDVSIRKFFDIDTFIMCSDGLTNYITDEQIMRKVQSSDSCQQIAEELVEMANSAGGSDNITVVIIKK